MSHVSNRQGTLNKSLNQQAMIEKLKQQIVNDHEKEKERIEIENRLQREEEELRRRQLEMGLHPNGGLAGTEYDTIGSHHGQHRDGMGTKRPGTKHKPSSQGAIISQQVQFSLCGSPKDLDDKDPLKDGKWTHERYDRNTRDSDPASPWRSIHDSKGTMADFMKTHTKVVKTKRTSSDAIDGQQRIVIEENMASKVVLKGALSLTLSNNSPYPIGLFGINFKVSRLPQNVLYSKRIGEIIDAFYASQSSFEEVDSNGKKNASSQEDQKFSSICLMKILLPNTTTSSVDDLVYKHDDALTSDLSADVMHNTLQAWVGISKQTFRECILNENVNNSDDPNEAVSFLKEDSVMWNFILYNWEMILTSLGLPINQAKPKESWSLPMSMVIPKEISNYPGLMSEEDKQSNISVHPVATIIVRKALQLADEQISHLPFEDLQNQQFYIARLDAPYWTSDQGHLTTSQIERIQDERVSVDAQLECWYDVVTEAIESSSQNPDQSGKQ